MNENYLNIVNKIFMEIFPNAILTESHNDTVFCRLVEERDNLVNGFIQTSCKSEQVKCLLKSGDFSVGHVYVKSLDLWMMRIHNESLNKTTIRNFYILFRIENNKAVCRECYLSFETCGERVCGWFVTKQGVVLFKSEIEDEDDETDVIVNHYRKKYQIIPCDKV